MSERFFYFSFQHIGSISVSGDKFTLFQGNNSSLLHFFKRIFRDDYIYFSISASKSFMASAFPSMHKEMADAITGSRLLSANAKHEAIAILADIPDPHTCLHGDFTTGNLITDGKDSYWIDLGWFSYGNPLFDLTQFFFYQKYLPTLFLRKVIHLNHRQIKAFSISLCKHYFQLHEAQEWQNLDSLVRKVMYIRVLKMAIEKDKPLAALVLIPIAQKDGGYKPTSRLKLLCRIILGKPLI